MGHDTRIQVVHKDLQGGSESLFIKVSEEKAKTTREYEIHIKSNDPSSLQVSRYDIENGHKTHPKTYKPKRAQKIYERFNTVLPEITATVLKENAIRIVSEKNHQTPDGSPGMSTTFYHGAEYVSDKNNDGKVDGLKFLYNGVQFIYTAEGEMNIAALESYSLPETGKELSYNPASFLENNFDSDADGTWTLPNAIDALRENGPTLDMVRVIDAYSASTFGNDQHVVTFFQNLRGSAPYLTNRFFLYYAENSKNQILKYALAKEVFNEPFKTSSESALYFISDFSLGGFRIKQAALIPQEMAQTLNQHVQGLLQSGSVEEVSWDDTFHGHPLFLPDNPIRNGDASAITAEEYFRNMDLVLYHTREGEGNWDSETSLPRSFYGSLDGNIGVVEGNNGYRQLNSGTAYGSDVEHEGKKGYEYTPHGLKVSAEGHTAEVEVQFYFTQTTEGRFRLSSGEAYDFYLVFSN